MTLRSLPGYARIQAWRETPSSILVQHFFRAFFDNEFISAHGEMRFPVFFIMAVLALPGVFICLFLYPKYVDLSKPFPPIFYHFPRSFDFVHNLPAIREQVSAADRLMFVSLSMILMGLATVMVWDTLFLDRRDYYALGPLPLSLGTLFKGKLSALFLFLVLFGLGINAVPSLVLPMWVSMGEKARWLPFLRAIFAHAITSLAACAFVFLFLVALLGIFLNLLPYRIFRKLSLYLQMASIVVLLAGFILMPRFASSLPQLKQEDGWLLHLVPALWFLGLHQTLLGSADQLSRIWGEMALLATGAVFVGALGTYLWTYRRYLQRMMEIPEIEPASPGRGESLLARCVGRCAVRKPREQAVFFFIVKTLTRSHKQHVDFAGWVALGFAFVFEGLVATHSGRHHLDIFEPSAALLSIPLVLSFFVLSGMRLVFTLPAELPAHWVFRVAEPESREESMAGVRKAMTLLGIVPLFGGLLPIAALLWGWGPALLQLVFGVTLALILEEVLLLRFQKIPFTCSFLPGKSNFLFLAAVCWVGFSIYAYTMAELEYAIIQNPLFMLVFMAVTIPVLWRLISYRNQQMREHVKLVFEDQLEPMVQTLGLLS